MWWFVIPLIILSFSYLTCIILLIYGWDSLPETPVIVKDEPDVTIIVAARNEEKYIATCINSLLSQTYPSDKIQIIIVDDYSADGTYSVVKSFDSVLVLQLKDYFNENELRSGKKKSIEVAMKHATGKYILITDADCIVPRNWVRTTISLFQSHKVSVVTGSICISDSAFFFDQLQALDMWSYISLSASAIGLGKPVLANGANFAFTKKIFFEVDGYHDSEHISSGDDVFLLHKFIKYGARVAFNKSADAVVITKPEEGLLSFFTQRVRWASKSASYKNFVIVLIITVVYLYYLSFPFCLVAALIYPVFIKWFVGTLIMKFFIDFIYLSRVLNFFRKRFLLQLFLPAQLFHIGYVILVGALALFIPVRWKGRKLYR
jgi:cellulose synthase/poly-beta-1,6-N-acetylglucosamine synthase-like glycosyltransferase